MKTNKKAILSAAAVLGVAGLAAGGTIAYFTDKDTKENNFTIGKVDIALYESQLHRMNSGRQGLFGPLASDPDYCDWNENAQDSGLDTNTSLIKGSYDKAKYCTPLKNANEGDRTTISALKNGHVKHDSRTWGYKDTTIEADALTYQAEDDPNTTDVDESGYFTRVSKNIVPGQYVRKFAYVKNEEASSDVYVLIRYMVPEEFADQIEVNMPSSGYLEDDDKDTDGVQPYFFAVEKDDATNKYAKVTFADSAALKGYTGKTETIEGKEYRVYAAVTNNVLNPGEMTFWSPVNTVRLTTDSEVTDFDYSNGNPLVQVKVDAQGIQAKTFSDAIEAINAL